MGAMNSCVEREDETGAMTKRSVPEVPKLEIPSMAMLPSVFHHHEEEAAEEVHHHHPKSIHNTLWPLEATGAKRSWSPPRRLHADYALSTDSTRSNSPEERVFFMAHQWDSLDTHRSSSSLGTRLDR
jgi:hypothetical protein